PERAPVEFSRLVKVRPDLTTEKRRKILRSTCQYSHRPAPVEQFATVRYRCNRSQLPGSAACSRDNVPSSARIHVQAGTEFGPVLRRAEWHNFAHERRRSCGASPVSPSLTAYCFSTCQTTR